MMAMMEGEDDPLQNRDDERPRYDAGQSGGSVATNKAAPGIAGRMSLAELTEAAGVSVRTVRYYISEGLLPPPEGAGPRSAYSAGHLDRLRLIQRLKMAYLPLREIRHRLAGVDDEAVKALLDRGSSSDAADALDDSSEARARDSLAMLETRERYRTEPLAFTTPPASADSPAPARPSPSERPRGESIAQERQDVQTPLGRPAQRSDQRARGEPPLWRRMPLGDEAELVVSDRVYERHRDRIEWLVRWAQKVFA